MAAQGSAGTIPQASGMTSRRQLVHLFLDGKTQMGMYFTSVTVALILLNIVSFVMSTVQGFDKSVYERFEQLEDVSLVLFTVEYLLRVWASADDPEHLGASAHCLLAWYGHTLEECWRLLIWHGIDGFVLCVA